MGCRLEDRPINEFNLLATPPQDLLLRLETLFFNGGSVTSIFGNTASQARHAKMKEAERERARDAERMFMEMALAEPERVAAFGERIQQLDEASMAALLENEKKLREAEEQLAEIRERAFSLTMPDGRNTKVYRDGGAVAEEDGTRVDFMRADDLPSETPELSEARAALNRFDSLTVEKREITAYRDKIEAGQERLHRGGMTQGELEDWQARLGEIPEPVTAHLKDAQAGKDAQADTGIHDEEKSLATPVRPNEAFSAAAARPSVDDFADVPSSEPPVNAPSPAASTPAPK